jgi:hypothetical protein
MTPDPIQESGGINLYDYCGNDPVDFVDPLGLVDLELENAIGSYQLVKDMQNVNPSGVYSVHAHGNEDIVEDDRAGISAHSGKDLTPAELLVLMILHGYKPREPIILYSCSTASGGLNSFASKLQQLAHAPVAASTVPVVHSGGTFQGDFTVFPPGANFPTGPAGLPASPPPNESSKH